MNTLVDDGKLRIAHPEEIEAMDAVTVEGQVGAIANGDATENALAQQVQSGRADFTANQDGQGTAPDVSSGTDEDPLLARPVGLHPLMKWPPDWLADAIRRSHDDAEMRSKLEQEIEQRVSATAKRIRDVDGWFSSEGLVDPARVNVAQVQTVLGRLISPQELAALGVTPIVSLIASPDGLSDVFRRNVALWSRDRVLTNDGAKVRFQAGGMRASKNTPEAIMLMLEEARARGWETIDISGPLAFRKQVAKMAREMNSGITVRDKGLLLKISRHYTSNVPGTGVKPDAGRQDGAMPNSKNNPAPDVREDWPPTPEPN